MNSQAKKEGKEKARKDLLGAIVHIKDYLELIGNKTLLPHAETLHQEIQVLLDETATQKKTMRRLEQEVSDLKEEIEKIKSTLEEAQATWIWESHVARFVISSGMKLKKFGKKQQMMDYVEGGEMYREEESTRWKQIQSALQLTWTKKHTQLMNDIRCERNDLAHPSEIDLDQIEKSLTYGASEIEIQRIEHMFKMLKLTASLMKFGRLVKDYQNNKSLLPKLSFTKEEERVADMIVKWDRDFQQIQSGLQCIDHDNAKVYLTAYVGQDHKAPYLKVVDSLKIMNGERLGDLALQFEHEVLHALGNQQINNIHDMIEWIKENSREWNLWMEITQGITWSSAHSDALAEMKNLRNLDCQNECMPDPETAKCVVPDFLEKSLWKSAFDIVDWFVKLPKLAHMTTRSRKRKSSPLHSLPK